MRLENHQKEVLSAYFLDISKALIIGAFASQTFATFSNVGLRLLYSMLHISVALLFLWLALAYKQDGQ